MTPSRDPELDLTETLRLAQRFGFLGARPVEEAIAHARQFVDALPDVRGPVVDLGSGGGLPGLVIAVDRPDLVLSLVDRRQKRTDFLRRAVVRLGLDERVTVHCVDAEAFARQHGHHGTAGDHRPGRPVADGGGFAAVTARGFGPPDRTLRLAASCRAPGGVVVISEPPPGAPDRWTPALLDELGLRAERRGAVAVFTER